MCASEENGPLTGNCNFSWWQVSASRNADEGHVAAANRKSKCPLRKSNTKVSKLGAIATPKGVLQTESKTGPQPWKRACVLPGIRECARRRSGMGAAQH